MKYSIHYLPIQWVNQFAEVTLLADSPGSPHMTGLDQQARVPAVSQTEGTSTRTRRPNRRHYLNIVTQNLRGLKTEERVAEMCHEMGSRNIFAACVQETWRTGREQLEHCQATLLLSGLGSGDGRGNRGSQGVGIVLGADATVAWRAVGSEVHDDLGARVIAARMMVRDSQKRDVGIFLVSAYGPIGAATEEAWDEFLTTLTICCSRKRREDILVIGSDINSSLGTDSSAASRTPASDEEVSRSAWSGSCKRSWVAVQSFPRDQWAPRALDFLPEALLWNMGAPKVPQDASAGSYFGRGRWLLSVFGLRRL